METKMNFEEDAGGEVAKGDLAQLTEAAKRLQKSNKQIVEAEEKLKSMKEERDRIEMAEIPDMMAELQLENVTLVDGSKVTVKNVVKASLPSATAIERQKDKEARENLIERLEGGLAWLRENGAEAIIDNQVSAKLGVGSSNLVEEAMRLLQGIGLEPIQTSTVNPQRLSKYIRERIESGAKDMPWELLSIYTGRKATITKPK